MMTDINNGKPWSEQDLRDLRDGLQLGTPIDELTTFLCRDVEEVRAKIAELEATTGR